MLMRGGTSKGVYFLAEDLPADSADRDDLLLRVMGSPDPRQIDGLGGAHPLTSKVAVVCPSADPDVDVDYLFLQVGVAEPTVSDRQNCGNLLAGIGPFAVECGLVWPGDPNTRIRIRMVNSDAIATASFPTPGGIVDYAGDAAISGVPGTAAPIVLDFADTAGSATAGLLPTGRTIDVLDGIPVSCVDNGMPVVVAAAADLGVVGYETPEVLAANSALRERLRSLRLQAGKLMGLGDVRSATIPKITLVAATREGGDICTRTFIPIEPHTSIGVLGAISVATAACLKGTIGHDIVGRRGSEVRFDIEHPTGHLQVEVELDTESFPPVVRRSAVLRTARKLFDGLVFPRS
jgi:4-oxalomesaconate tautomerase